MSGSALLLQFLNGLAGANSLFLVAAGLSLIFGVSRIVNFAHGSLYMLGMYVAVWLAPATGFWVAVLLAALVVAATGALVEIAVLRRLYKAPELLQLLATFALVLIVRDFALWAWGPQDMLGPRAPGFRDAVSIAGAGFPRYDLLLIALGPVVFVLLHALLTRTRWGTLVRAATEDREMAAALGVNQRWLFTGIFMLGALLAGAGTIVHYADAVSMLDYGSPLGVCLRRSLVRYVLLRRAGVPVVVHFGAKKDLAGAQGRIAGHAWLTLDGQAFAENPQDYEGFTAIYSYPQKTTEAL